MRSDDYAPSRIHTTWTARVLSRLESEPDRAAIVSVSASGSNSVSSSDFRQLTAGAASRLDQEGVARGTLVPALLTQRPSSVALLLAGALTGRPLAPLSPRMTQRELAACLQNIDGDVLVAEPTSFELAATLGEQFDRRVIVLDEIEPETPRLTAGTDPEATAFAMHTSGTTGLPKRVAVKEGPLGHRGDVNGYLLDLREGDRFVATSLFHHVGGLGNIAVALANGATLITFPDFSVDAWRGIQALEPTHAVVVPTVIEMLLSADALRLPSMRVMGYGGSPIHPETMRRVQEVMPGVEFVNLFGQTEGSPITVLDPRDHVVAATSRPELLKSVGRPAPGATVVIHDPDEEGVGEVWARTPHSFVVDDEGWQRTGDLGRFEGDYLYLVGRRGDKIIRGGENVYPVEVEQILRLHPQVSEAVVVGIPDPRLGETIAAIIVANDPLNPPEAEDLRGFTREHLAGFKVPVHWDFTEELPRNSSGKVLRKEIANRAAQARSTT